jgi:hypothetical protein
MPSINCQRCGEPFARAKLKGGPRQRFCSSRCRTATHRDIRPSAKQAKTPIENIGEFQELRYTNGRTATQSPQDTRRYRGGIVGPRSAIQGAVINAREWTEVGSPDGVKSYVSQLGKRALVEGAA